MLKRILYNKWIDLCDTEYTTGMTLPPNKSIVFVHMEHIYDFFRNIEKSKTKNNYVVVSAASDYGFVKQAENPVWLDMYKWATGFSSYSDVLGYNPLVIPPRCDTRFCKIDDTYSIKMYSHTGWTLSNIPDNILHWYSTNNEIVDSRITHIPFGIPNWSNELIPNNTESVRESKIYYSCSPNNLIRTEIQKFYKNDPHYFVFDNGSVEHEVFVKNLLKYQFIACPPGNGIDTFRVLESLYCGAVPILLDNVVSSCYDGLPVIRVESFGKLNLKNISFKTEDLIGTKADFNYWKDLIHAKTHFEH
jgi:hypothetical protein